MLEYESSSLSSSSSSSSAAFSSSASTCNPNNRTNYEYNNNNNNNLASDICSDLNATNGDGIVINSALNDDVDSSSSLLKKSNSTSTAIKNNNRDKRVIDNRTYSIEEYEKRFLDSLKKLNANAPKWLVNNLKMNQLQPQQRQTAKLNDANSTATTTTTTNPVVYSNKKPKYERIKLRSRQQRERECERDEEYMYESRASFRHPQQQQQMNCMKNSKSLGYLNSHNLRLIDGESTIITTNKDTSSQADSTTECGDPKMKRSLSNYSYNNLLKQPLSISNNSLNNNNNWYKPKSLQLPSTSMSNANSSSLLLSSSSISNQTESKLNDKNTRQNTGNSENDHHQQQQPQLERVKVDDEKMDKKLLDELERAEMVEQAQAVELNNNNNNSSIKQQQQPQQQLKSDSGSSLESSSVKTTSTAINTNQRKEASTVAAATAAAAAISENERIEAIIRNREKYLVTRLDYRHDDEQDEINELYDNLNNSSLVDEDDDDDDDDDDDEDDEELSRIDERPVGMNNNKSTSANHGVVDENVNDLDKVVDYENIENMLNTRSFIITNSRSNAPLPPGSGDYEFITYNPVNQGMELNSEEIEDEDDDVPGIDDEVELRNYDHNGDQSMCSNEDEFFLISTPSPFNLASVATARSGYGTDSFQIIDTDNNQQAPAPPPPHPTRYEINRLSNIIEEEDDAESNDKRPPGHDTMDAESVRQYKEMLKLGEEVSQLYQNIQNELNRPDDDAANGTPPNYRPCMKKRIYHLNGAYLDSKGAQVNKPTSAPTNSKQQVPNVEPDKPNVYKYKLENQGLFSGHVEPDLAMMDCSAHTNEDSNNILNYLINRLSEQHKTKLEPVKKKLLDNNDTSTTDKINTEFEKFERHLFEKYGLPMFEQSSGGGDIESSETTNAAPVDDDPDGQLLELVDNLKPTAADTSSNFVLTRSLYAQHKTINLPAVDVPVPTDHKIVTALSINEIQTKTTTKINERLNDIDLENDKQIKEEIVLIGEKSDIESLLDNENNQLYNLIMANSSRTSKLDRLETDLNKQRLDEIKNATTTAPNVNEDIEIEIEIAETEPVPATAAVAPIDYEKELKNLAKYLVSEITKISLNKVKIDYLNDNLDKKQQLENSIMMNIIPDGYGDQLVDTDLKSKEEILDYYSNLEKNLQQVRSEIDKLKQEAYDDLIYINNILNQDDVATVTAPDVVEDLIDYDQVYLKNNEDDSPPSGEKIIEPDEEEEEETQYLSQPASALSQPPSSSVVDSSQMYLTPAESWQTLKIKDDNNNGTLKRHQKPNVQQVPLHLTPRITGLHNDVEDEEDDDGNQTDLDQENELENVIVVDADPRTGAAVVPAEDEDEDTLLINSHNNSFNTGESPAVQLASQSSKQISQLVKDILNKPILPPVDHDEIIVTPPSSMTKSKTHEANLSADPSHRFNVRSKSTGPIRAENRNTTAVLVDRKSLDKFLKLASNSASLLDLNQANTTTAATNPNSLNSSNAKLKTSSSNLLSLCGTEQQQPQIKRPTPAPAPVASQPPPPQQQHQPVANRPKPSVAPRQQKNNRFDSQLENLLKEKQQQEQQQSQSGIDSGSQIISTFRIPSSRHFCGRLMSVTTATSSSSGSSSVSSSSATNSSASSASTSSTSSTSSQYSATGKPISVTNKKPKKYTSSEEDEDDEEISIESESDDAKITIDTKIHRSMTNSKNKFDSAVALSTSSPSTASSSPQSVNQHKKAQQVQAALKSQASPNIYRVHFETEKNSTTTTTTTTMPKQKTEQPAPKTTNSSVSTENINGKGSLLRSSNTIERMYEQRIYEKKIATDEKPPQQKQQMSQAKSVEFLNGNSSNKAQMLIKQIDLDSQKDISNIIAANSRQMTLSKSIKDLRLYVSNSYSPSQIVRPPPPTQEQPQQQTPVPTTTTTKTKTPLAKPTSNRISNNNYNDETYMKTNVVAEQRKTMTMTLSTNSSSDVSPGSQNPYVNTMMRPFKDQKSDQVRIEYLKQQQLIARLQKEQLIEHLHVKQQVLKQPMAYQTRQAEMTNSRASVMSNAPPMPPAVPPPTIKSIQQQQQANLVPAKQPTQAKYVNNAPMGKPNDDSTLINCILEMKPPPQNQTRQFTTHTSLIKNYQEPANVMPSRQTSINSSQNTFKSTSGQNANILPSKPTITSNRSLIAQQFQQQQQHYQSSQLHSSNAPPVKTVTVPSNIDTRKRVKKETNL